LRATVRHYYDFGADRRIVGADLVTPEAWDGLRLETSGAFSIPGTRIEFERSAEQRPDIAARARAINRWLDGLGARVIASYGVGGATLEWWLQRTRRDRKLIVTDYGEATVERLARLFPGATVRYHDLRRDDPIPADVHLFHRIDTELTNDEWLATMQRFRSVPVLVVAAEVLDLRRFVLELRHRLVQKRRGASKAGFIRTRAALEALWRPTHSAQPLRMYDLEAWALAPRDTAALSQLRGARTSPA
jgi:hypothetical protein